MTERMSSKEYRKLVEGKGKSSKYNASPKRVDGWRFDSQKEARYYTKLKLMQKAGEISFFLMQVPVPIMGNKKHRVDFLVFYPDGSWEFHEVKGYETEPWRLKRDYIEDHYPFKIKVV